MIKKRPRRLRTSPSIRKMVQETTLTAADLIQPVFVVEGEGIRREIPSMKGVYHLSVDQLKEEIQFIQNVGIQAILLFGLPCKKNPLGTEAYEKNGIVQRAIRHIKAFAPDLCVITDVCLCQYTSHGHCGIVTEKGIIDNDETLVYLSKIAVSHADAGADIVAPSDMMDGRVGAIRNALDAHDHKEVAILSYAVKYASALYGPFRDAADSAPHFGDRKTYQMDVHNRKEAIREMEFDVEEGADFLMVKPALFYLDVLRDAKDRFHLPMVAYNVSGEYMMLRNVVDQGILSESLIYEAILSIKRAGADLIITYFAKELAEKWKKDRCFSPNEICS